MKPGSRAALNLLRTRGRDGLTEAEATTAIGCRRLAARVWELRQAGFDIESVAERAPNGSHYARYFLKERTAPEPTTGQQLAIERLIALVDVDEDGEHDRDGDPAFNGSFR